MHLAIIFRILGILLMLFSLTQLIPLGVSIYESGKPVEGLQDVISWMDLWEGQKGFSHDLGDINIQYLFSKLGG